MIDPTSRNKIPYQYIISEPLVYPTLAAGATLQTPAPGSPNWTLSVPAVIVPGATIAGEFIVNNFVIEWCDKDAIFQIQFYHGATNILFAAYRFAIKQGFFGNTSINHLNSPVIPGGSQITAAIASSDGFANQATLTISIGYVLT